MEGVDEDYQQQIEGFFGKLIHGMFDIFVDKYVSSRSRRAAARQEMHGILDGILNQVGKDLENHRQKSFVGPIIQAVASLPKEELALLAEALVKLTSLKRKISLEPETVGEPVDVAVISKGDGFVWIRRKHYFDPALNPAFMSRYIGQEGTLLGRSRHGKGEKERGD